MLKWTRSFRVQRNIWIFAGICFMLAVFIFVFEEKTVDLRTILNGLVMLLSFFNAYLSNKKIKTDKSR